MSKSQPQTPDSGLAAHEQNARYRELVRRHDEAVVHCEAERLARVLRPYGVLHRDVLAEIAGASRWHDGGLQRALSEALASGVIEELPFGFYRAAELFADQP